MAWDAKKYWLSERDRNNAYAFVANYRNWLQTRATMLRDTTSGDGLGASGTRYAGRPTESKAIHMQELEDRIGIIEKALDCMPWRYRDMIISHMCEDKPYPKEKARSCQRWANALLWTVSEELKKAKKKSRG